MCDKYSLFQKFLNISNPPRNTSSFYGRLEKVQIPPNLNGGICRISQMEGQCKFWNIGRTFLEQEQEKDICKIKQMMIFRSTNLTAFQNCRRSQKVGLIQLKHEGGFSIHHVMEHMRS